MARMSRDIATVSTDHLASIEFASVDTLTVRVPTQVIPDSLSHGVRPEGGDSPGEAACRGRETDSTEELVGPLVREMDESWRQGGCSPAEVYLARHPELLDDAEAATRLISEEIRLRREHGYEISTAEFVRRFPQWETRLVELIDLMSSMSSLDSFDASRPLPVVGEAIGEFQLLSTLGRGIRGSVYLAVQPTLANRPVVLKITPRKGSEHLTLARLQHAHIVPLYWVQDLADRDLRVLCMPYLGGATLARLLSMVGEIPPERRTGRDLLNALDEIQSEAPIVLPMQGPARQFLAQASYVQAVCWIGACLADALHFAHQRELLHLDLKPFNILLAADGTPMLLDFHLAQPPIRSRGSALRRLGGTPAYMSPEQWTAMLESRDGRTVAVEVDGRSDIYALGRMLAEALGGRLPAGCWIPTPQQIPFPPQVSAGLADIITRCLKQDPRDRYPDAALLASDLRRHLTDQPLRGVANRSWVERWRKWRRRRPHALGRMTTIALALAALLIAGLVVGGDVRQRLRRAESALAEGRTALDQRDYAAAARILGRGLALTDPSPILVLGRLVPRVGDLRTALDAQLRLARRAETADELHRLVDSIRLLSGSDLPATGPMRARERRLRETWEARTRILQMGGDLSPEETRRLQADLLELGIFWANLRVRLATGREAETRRRDALRVLDEAEALFGDRPVLERERQSYAEALGLTDMARAAARRLAQLTPSTAWEHYALGRSLLDAGDLEAATREFDAATDLQPQDLWSHFCRGLCAYRLRHFEAAAAAFDVCVALAPRTAECYYNRARSRAALGRADLALRDYDHALQLAPDMAMAALNRGVLLFREGRYPDAITDFQRALAGEASPAAVHYNLALAHRAQGDHAAARANLESALRLEPDEADFRALERRLRGDRRER